MKSEKKNERDFDANISPVDWYVAGVLLRIEVGEKDKKNENRRCDAWENKILVKAKNPEEAYRKAVKFGKLEESKYLNPNGEKVKFTFEGLTTLIPIYDEFEDGSEIIWIEHENKAVKTIKSWVKPKEKLEVFQRN